MFILNLFLKSMHCQKKNIHEKLVLFKGKKKYVSKSLKNSVHHQITFKYVYLFPFFSDSTKTNEKISIQFDYHKSKREQDL